MPIEFEPNAVRAAMATSLRQVSEQLDTLGKVDMGALTTNFLAGGTTADTALEEFASSLSDVADKLARNRQIVHSGRVLPAQQSVAAEKFLDDAYSIIGTGASKTMEVHDKPLETQPLADLLTWMDGTKGTTAPAQAKEGVDMVTTAIEKAGIESPTATAAADAAGDLAGGDAKVGAGKVLMTDTDAI